MSRLPIVCLVTLLGCRDGQVGEGTRRSPLETGIARDLTARFGTPVTVTCKMATGVPVACDGTLADGTQIPIAIDSASKNEWGWHVDGLVVEARDIVTYVEDELAALRLSHTVTCGPPVHVVQAGDRIACTLSNGGAAFVEIAADGATTLELALDKQSAAARSELVTPDRDRALIEQSKALEVLEWESDGEEAVAADGGVPRPR